MGALAAPQVPDFVRLLYDIDELRVNSKEFQDKAKELRDRPDKVQATEFEGEKREIYLHLGDFASGSLRLSQPPRVGPNFKLVLFVVCCGLCHQLIIKFSNYTVFLGLS